MPYAIKQHIEKELDSMIFMGIITKVDHSKRATPILKQDGKVGICDDYHIKLHKFLNEYPISNLEKVLCKMHESSIFSKFGITLSVPFKKIQLSFFKDFPIHRIDYSLNKPA
ncbi:hypothetical protein ILUMI_06319 [Ignelater luminosus]|uniref:Uncharacterized protein n=1 Tax=Ignelater luminosus TaxID=2038154 RepID=A0A8K0DAJ2_IGNLU|nr:hypothetical protein ILUMI_06319 [Ignelater luminosus]